MLDTAVFFEKVCVSQKRKKILDNISFQIRQNEVVGLLGLNGAGKTTLIHTVLGLLKPTSGQVLLYGKKPKQSWVTFLGIGYSPETPAFPDFLTVTEFLNFVGILRNKKNEVDEWLDLFAINEKKIIKLLSKGQMKKIALIQAFIGNPKLIILDEPLNGLDPLATIKLRELILARKNTTSFFISSHIISEMEKLCDRVLILRNGKLEYMGYSSEFVTAQSDLESLFKEIHAKPC